MSGTQSGTCFCGAVEIKVTGEPNAMGYCHCESCRSWSAGPVNAFTLWSPEAVEVTKGAENIATFQKTDMSQRQFCQLCGGHVMTAHPPLNMIDVYAATIPGLTFVPQGQRARLYDIDVPKECQLPAEAGTPGDEEDARLVETA